jgi:tetratricopeptide (TPR) repeat protein
MNAAERQHDARARVEEMRSRVPAAKARQLREAVRAEEAARLADAGLGAAQCGRAAEAFAALADYFSVASVSDSLYDTDSSQVQALDDAIEALAAAREDERHRDLAPDRRAMSALQMARVLRERYEVAGDPEDLHRALALADEAVDIARREAPGVLAEALQLLGQQLTADFDRDARRERIDRAVQVLHEASAVGSLWQTALGPPVVVSLAAALLLRAKALGELADFDEAARILQRAAVERPDSAAVFDALGCVLVARAEQTESMGDLEGAVEAAERAVNIAPENPWFKASLAVALRRPPGRAARRRTA